MVHRLKKVMQIMGRKNIGKTTKYLDHRYESVVALSYHYGRNGVALLKHTCVLDVWRWKKKQTL